MAANRNSALPLPQQYSYNSPLVRIDKRKTSLPLPASSTERIQPPTKRRRFLGNPIPVNPNPNGLLLLNNGPLRCREESPFKEAYCRIGEEDNVTVAYKVDKSFKTVIIHDCHVSRDAIGFLKEFSHRNVVALYEAFFLQPTIFLVYEDILLRLSDLQASPARILEEYEAAAILKETLYGLSDIHERLNINHGAINSDNILLKPEGIVKLGKIGEAMLNNDTSSRRKDFVSIALLLLRLREPGGNNQTPEKPEIWSDKALKFRENANAANSAHDLIKDEFLQLSPGPECLKPFIRGAMRTTYRCWHFID